MPDINKQEIAKFPTNQSVNFIFDFRNGWNTNIKRIWGRKEIERRCFRTTNGRWFECGPQLADLIIETVAKIFEEYHIDIKKVESVPVSIVKTNGPQVFVNVEMLPKLTKMRRVWVSIKGLLGA